MPYSQDRERERGQARREDAAYRERQAERERERCRDVRDRSAAQNTDLRIQAHHAAQDRRAAARSSAFQQRRLQRNAQAWWRTFKDYMAQSLRRMSPPTWDRSCNTCGAKLLKGEVSTFCCQGGNKRIPPLPPLPENIAAIASTDTSAAALSRYSRRLNSLFSFTAIGATGHFQTFRTGPANVAINGRTYHRIFDIADRQHSLHWYLYDENERESHGQHIHVPVQWTRALNADLANWNPYVRHLRRFDALPMGQTTALELTEASINGDFAAIMHSPNSTVIQPRSILIWRNSDRQPSFIPICSRHYEPLQYPLLFPHGTSGWGPGIPLPARENQRRPTVRLNWTALDWCRARLLQDVDGRFSKFGRLTSEYVVDMYSRIEENRLRFVQHSRVDYARELDPTLADDQSIDINLPASFLGSRAWTSLQTADGLALARRYGKPSYFITFTCNPHWPEIEACLREGQTASDVPVVVARAFKLRLQRFLEILRHRFGQKIYMIKVIEFQKRGLPHAHIILKVRGHAKQSYVVSS